MELARMLEAYTAVESVTSDLGFTSSKELHHWMSQDPVKGILDRFQQFWLAGSGRPGDRGQKSLTPSPPSAD